MSLRLSDISCEQGMKVRTTHVTQNDCQLSFSTIFFFFANNNIFFFLFLVEGDDIKTPLKKNKFNSFLAHVFPSISTIIVFHVTVATKTTGLSSSL